MDRIEERFHEERGRMLRITDKQREEDSHQRKRARQAIEEVDRVLKRWERRENRPWPWSDVAEPPSPWWLRMFGF